MMNDFLYRGYADDIGIFAGGTKLPDPSEWNYQVGDLDTSGSRDATGLLHRTRVATKVNYEFKWNCIGWDMLQHILTAVSADKFTLTAPDPRTFNTAYTGDYYVGDRTGKCYHISDDREDKATFDLKLKFIEY